MALRNHRQRRKPENLLDLVRIPEASIQLFQEQSQRDPGKAAEEHADQSKFGRRHARWLDRKRSKIDYADVRRIQPRIYRGFSQSGKDAFVHVTVRFVLLR